MNEQLLGRAGLNCGGETRRHQSFDVVLGLCDHQGLQLVRFWGMLCQDLGPWALKLACPQALDEPTCHPTTT